MLEIKNMLNSYNEALVEVGLFLYRRNNGEDGLSPIDTYELIKLIDKVYSDEEIGEQMNREYIKGFDEGFEEAKRYYKDCNRDERVEVSLDVSEVIRK